MIFFNSRSSNLYSRYFLALILADINLGVSVLNNYELNISEVIFNAALNIKDM